MKGGGGGGWILAVVIFNLSNIYNIWTNAMSLETIWCGWLVFIDFDVTMETNFDKHFYSENEKSFSFLTVIVTTFLVLVEFPLRQ